MSDRETAMCQIGLSSLFFIGYFSIVLLFMLGHAKIPTDYKEIFSGLLALQTGGGLTILHFWFQRSRGLTTTQQGAQ